MHLRKDAEHVAPPVALLLSGALDEGGALRGADGQGEGVAGCLLGVYYLQHPRHVDGRLRDRRRLGTRNTVTLFSCYFS